jgi:hypothetical protein
MVLVDGSMGPWPCNGSDNGLQSTRAGTYLDIIGDLADRPQEREAPSRCEANGLHYAKDTVHHDVLAIVFRVELQ